MSDTLPDLLPLLSSDSEFAQECIDRYGGLVWSLARRHSPSSADAEDAVQDIFLAIWKNAARFDPRKASEAAFITVIARRRLIDLGRKRQRRPQTTEINPEWDFPGSGARQLEASAEARRAAEEIRRLEPKERDAVLLSTCHGFSHSQIAERTGLPLGTVKTYVRRGLQRVRDALNAPPSPKPPAEVSS